MNITKNEMNNSPNFRTLQDVIQSVDIHCENFPETLPIAHLSIARFLKSILNAQLLIPNDCKVFNEKLLYFSYGGVFHRSRGCNLSYSELVELPVAFLFKPTLLQNINYCCPYDTGAAHDNKYGDSNVEFKNYSKYRIQLQSSNSSNIVSKLICCIFKDNENYINGRVQLEHCQNKLNDLPNNCPNLCDFLHSNNISRTGEGEGENVDMRKNKIELQTTNTVSIFEHLVWIGIPQHFIDDFINALNDFNKSNNKNLPYPAGLEKYAPAEFKDSFVRREVEYYLEVEAEKFIRQKQQELPVQKNKPNQIGLLKPFIKLFERR